jgi:hypothetical protein
MLSREVPVVVDERFHRFRKAQHIRDAVDLQPLTVEAVGEHAQRSAWLPA